MSNITAFNVHDNQLFEKITSIFSKDLQMYLKNFDFSNTGDSNVFNKLFEFDHYSDSLDYVFMNIDDEFQENYNSLKKSISNFLYTFTIYTTPVGNSSMFHVASAYDWEVGDSTRYRKEANEINENARILFEEIKKFILNGKERVYVKDEIVPYSVREFNELFNKVNIPDTKEYLSGPEFFKIVIEVDPNHPDYSQVIEERRKRGQSTTRKIMYKDILDQLDNHKRNTIIDKINQRISTAKIEGQLDETLSYEKKEDIVRDDFINIDTPKLNFSKYVPPKVFISYSWDNESHKEWVLKLSKDLRTNGIETILDRYVLSPGKNASYFMESIIEDADKVLIIFTENYKMKADKRSGGVGVEYSILNSEISKNIIANSKYIPILRQGSMETSIPKFMQQYIAIYMHNESQYEEKIKELTHAIFEKSMVEVPEIGQKPDYI